MLGEGDTLEDGQGLCSREGTRGWALAGSPGREGGLAWRRVPHRIGAAPITQVRKPKVVSGDLQVPTSALEGRSLGLLDPAMRRRWRRGHQNLGLGVCQDVGHEPWSRGAKGSEGRGTAWQALAECSGTGCALLCLELEVE